MFKNELAKCLKEKNEEFGKCIKERIKIIMEPEALKENKKAQNGYSRKVSQKSSSYCLYHNSRIHLTKACRFKETKEEKDRGKEENINVMIIKVESKITPVIRKQ